jgi:hypothetical protein
MPQQRTLLELEKIVADFLGFDQKVIMVEQTGSNGDFRAIITGRTAWLSKATAQAEADKACATLRATYRLKI